MKIRLLRLRRGRKRGGGGPERAHEGGEERKGERGVAFTAAPHPRLESIPEEASEGGPRAEHEYEHETNDLASVPSESEPRLSEGASVPVDLRDARVRVPCVEVVPAAVCVDGGVGASVSRAGGDVVDEGVPDDKGLEGPRVDQGCTSEMPECDPVEEPRRDPPHAAFSGVATRAGSRKQRRKAEVRSACHARFLQHLFRGYVRLRPGAWGKPGGLCACPAPWRPVTTFRCRGGMCLAHHQEYEEMRSRAREVMDWQNIYVAIRRRLKKAAPRSYHPYSAGGADSYGVRRAGGIPFGTDIEHQQSFEEMFGVGSFEVSDASDRAAFLSHVARVNPVLIAASPPCKKHSTSDMQKRSTAEEMIALTRDSCEQTGRLYVIENVKGAASEMRDHALLLYGAYFGLRVDRPRFFEANFALHLDEYMRGSGLALRARGCLGPRRKWRRLDPFGRPEPLDCCPGTLYPMQGVAPFGFTPEEGAAAMGIEPGHMSFERMAQAVPPDYGEWIFGQACMAACEREYGVPRISFDEMRRDPAAARKRLHFWLRGAGSAEADVGMQVHSRGETHLAEPSCVAAEGAAAPAWRTGSPAEAAAAEDVAAMVDEVEFREVYYSRRGDFQQQFTAGRPRWLEAIHGDTEVPSEDRVGWMTGRSTHLHLSWRQWREWQLPVCEALGTMGTRVMLQLRRLSDAEAATLKAVGFSRVRVSKRGRPAYATATESATQAEPCEWWSAGERRSCPPGFKLNLEEAEAQMDPRDRGELKDDVDAKRMRTFLPVEWDPGRWNDTGLPEWIEVFMKSGVVIEPVVEPPMADHPFYHWETDTHLLMAIQEADRHLSIGALKYVPDDMVRHVAENAIVHPWVVVKQGEKWRLCHDYSVGTNKYVRAAPFGLPSPWDVGSCVKPGSFFAKYDIRDGFFHVPVHPDSWKRLVVRHPGTGRLMWAPRLPFGYVASPFIFCALTEAIANKLRKKAAGMGIHFFVFVDDYLVVGDTEELTLQGCAMLEAELEERGISWAPHKHRGPARCMEFLGLLLANLKDQQGISLTRKRRDGLLSLIDEWERWRASAGRPGRRSRAVPRELASLLGKLVFASQVVWNGRPFMQAMLSSFAGYTVDWIRGAVSFHGGERRHGIELSDGFWEDLRWWKVHLQERYSVPWSTDELAVAAITGTDASGWGTGQLAWVDGQRVETQLEFTHAERRRPINWRELLGIVRIVEQFGSLLRGRVVLIETDNMAAKGAASKRSSKAEDMQELVRRLVDACEKHQIKLRMTHTPGAKLDRPDQTSRGDLVEEPRQRLTSEWFGRIEKAFGTFSSFLGPERHHGLAAVAAGGSAKGGERLWLHPTYATVGSALRLMHERAAASLKTGGAFRAMALIPDDESAGWNALLKHSAVVARLGMRYDTHEQYRAGAWRPVAARRDMKLILYPRVAGGAVATLPVMMPDESRWESLIPAVSEEDHRPLGYEVASDGDHLIRSMFPGSFVYMPGEGGARGRMFRVAQPMNAGELAGGDSEVDLAPMLKNSVRKSGEEDTYDWDKQTEPVTYEPSNLWVIDHLVREVNPMELLRKRSGESFTQSVERAAELTFRRYWFDWHVAQREIVAAKAALQASDSWVLLDDRSEDAEFYVSPGSTESIASFGGSARPPCSGGETPADHEVSQARVVEEESRDALADVLAGLNLETAKAETVESHDTVQSGSADVGAGSGTGETEGARVAKVEDPGLPAVNPIQRTPQSGKAQVYAGMACGGCGEYLRTAGVFMLGGVVHARQACKLKMARKIEMAEILSRGRAVGAVPLSMQKPGAATAAVGAPQAASLAGGLSEKQLLRPDRPIGRDRSVGATEPSSMSARAEGGGEWRRVQADASLSMVRKAAIRRCIDGECELQRCAFLPTQCTHCTRMLHVAECGQFGTARAAVGRFKCFYCRAEEMAPTREPTEARLSSAMETMIIQLELGSEATAAATADYNKLEQDFVVEKGLEGDEMLLPRHQKETFLAFLTWCYRDAGRARSMKSLWRHLGGVFQTWELKNLTEDWDAKRHQKKLESQWSLDPDPTVSATERMAEILVLDVIPADREASELLMRRDQLQCILEAYGGLRVGEAADGGQGHGFLCENMSWVEDEATGEGFLDLVVMTSKTGHVRYTGVTRYPTKSGKIDVKEILLRYWWAMGAAELVTSRVGKLTVTKADRSVVRVSLLGMRDEGDVGKLINVLHESGSMSANLYLKSTCEYAKARVKAVGKASMTKKFVNVAVGTKSSTELQALMAFLRARGYGHDRVHLISAPLICATTGGARARPTLMPLSSGSLTGGVMKRWLVEAARSANMEINDPDPDMNIPVGEIEKAKWGTHSLRRLADKRIKLRCEELGLPASVVDAMMGWKEAERAHDMQDHYDEKNLMQRLERSRITRVAGG